MARGFAYAYKQGQRPADEPAGNYKVTPLGVIGVYIA